MGDNTTHSALSPSARHRWGACPGSVREEAKFPESPGGSAADDGTRTHTLLEQAIKFEFVDKAGICGPMPYFGQTITDEFGTYTVDADRCKRLNVAMEYIRTRVAEQGTTAIPETRVYPDGLVLRADMNGTIDVQIPGKNVYEIIDYKDGMSPVVARDNPQLELYALGVIAGMDQDKHPNFIRMTIIQPKLALRGMPVISSHDVPVSDLLAMAPIVQAQGSATEDPNAPLVPGESQCKYCRAKGACPAIAGKVMQEVGLMFSPVAVNPEVLPPEAMDVAQQAANQDPAMMSDDRLRQLLEAKPLMLQLLAGVETEVERRLMSGKPVAGFKMVAGKGSRKWAFPEEEIAKKLAGMGMPKTAIYKTELVSPAQAEKAVWDKKGEPQKLSDIQLKRMNTEYITSGSGKPTVALESDPRPAILIDTSSMFSAVGTPSFLSAPVESAPLPSFLQVPTWLS